MKLPKVEKRTYKEPVNLIGIYYELYDYHYADGVLKFHKETEKRSEDIYITDVFYKLKNVAEWKYGYSLRRVQGGSKYPCIGGPLDGKKSVLNIDEYQSYNCGNVGRMHKKGIPSCILVHESLLCQS